VALRLPLAVLSALLLCSCEVYAVPNPPVCPGVQQGVFDFAAEQVVAPGDCVFAQPSGGVYQVLGSFAFSGAINFDASGNGAALCKSAPHARPNLGTHTGLAIDVAEVFTLTVNGCKCGNAETAAAAKCACPPDSPGSNCSCPVVLEQRITGALSQAVTGVYDGFSGTLLNTVTVEPLPAPTARCDCQDPCSYAYDLAATVVGSR
jgi:hypothetical protein